MRLAAMICAAGILGLVGCSDGDGDGGGSGPAPFPPAPSSFAAHAADGAAIFAEAEGLPFTDPAALPADGSATYTGQLGVYRDDGLGPIASGALRADLQVTADFGDDAIMAGATNFVTGDDVQLDGDVRFGDGDIFRDADVTTEYTFAADGASGVLTTPGGASLTVDGGHLYGDFRGTSPGYVNGEAQLVIGSDADGAGPGSVMDGGFEAERD